MCSLLSIHSHDQVGLLQLSIIIHYCLCLNQCHSQLAAVLACRLAIL